MEGEGKEVSVCIGGRAGDGISSAGQVIAQLLSRLGYRVHMYFDYPSLIKGGHNFALVRGAAEQPGAARESAGFLIALNQETITRHRHRLGAEGTVILDSGKARANGAITIPVGDILASVGALPVMRNSALIGAFSRAAGMAWEEVEPVLRMAFPRETSLNLEVARRGYDAVTEDRPVPRIAGAVLPVFTGNEAIGLGLVRGGLQAYFGYPMSPTSNLFHFLVGYSQELGIPVVQPEGEIAVVQMALGGAYAGCRTAVGTSGGGFCLMTESVSLAGIAELPLVVVLGQRTGPSTGLATYTAQSDLPFALSAGHGTFPRLVVAPGDAEEAYAWSWRALDLAWKYQLPAFVLADKTLCEGLYSFDPGLPSPSREETILADPSLHPYHRYALTGTGISPLRFPPAKGEVIRANSHVHDPPGITTEEPELTIAMADKRRSKGAGLAREIEGLEPVRVGGEPGAVDTVICWGSNAGACREAGRELGLRVVSPLVLSPFPEESFARALEGSGRLIAAELNEGGDLACLVRQFGFRVDALVLKYNGRPFFVEELCDRLREAAA
jgi:2-oxoglutarate ferredoxin oxidoreductase subunit alpha